MLLQASKDEISGPICLLFLENQKQHFPVFRNANVLKVAECVSRAPYFAFKALILPPKVVFFDKSTNLQVQVQLSKVVNNLLCAH